MIYLLSSSVIVNILIILLFSVLYFIKDETEPKHKALLSSLSGAALLLYLILFVIISVFGIIIKDIFLSSFVIFAVIPFVIGKMASFETLKKYLLLQIFSFVLSLIFLIIIFP